MYSIRNFCSQFILHACVVRAANLIFTNHFANLKNDFGVFFNLSGLRRPRSGDTGRGARSKTGPGFLMVVGVSVVPGDFQDRTATF